MKTKPNNKEMEARKLRIILDDIDAADAHMGETKEQMKEYHIARATQATEERVRGEVLEEVKRKVKISWDKAVDKEREQGFPEVWDLGDVLVILQSKKEVKQ